MIVPAMTHEELSREILSDIRIVRNKAIYLGQKYNRKARRTKRKNFRTVIEYMSKQKNRWLILFDCENSNLMFFTAVCFVDTTGLNVIAVERDIRTLNHYYSHFFKRYNERYVKQNNMQKIELIKRFLFENPWTAFRKIDDPEENKIRLFGRLREGVALGYRENVRGNEYRILKTFISEEMIKSRQIEDLEYTTNLYKSVWDEDFQLS